MSYASIVTRQAVHASVADGRILLNAAALKILRKTRGISQEGLAELCFNHKLCVSIASIKRAETHKPVLYRTARHLASIFEVGLDVLVDTGQQLAGATHAMAHPPAPAGAAHVEGLFGQIIRYVLELRFDLRASAGGPFPVLDAVTELARQFGGVPRWVDADGTMISAVHFGYPHAYRSDSERALLFAFRLRGEELVDPDRAMRLRMLRWPEEFDSTTDMSIASGGGTIYVASNLVTQLDTRFSFAGPAPEAPGFRACVRALSPQHPTPHDLFGRAVEVLQFRSVVEATEDCQDGHVVYVRGTAGIGKTRLLTEFSAIARQQGFAGHHADVLDFNMDAWSAPLAQLVRSILAMPEPSARNVPAIAQTLAEWKLPGDSVLFLRVLLGDVLSHEAAAIYTAMDSEARNEETLRAVQWLLLRAALQKPLLLCIEDLHWADPRLLAALGRLLALTDEAPIVWVLTSRSEGDPLEASLRPRFSTTLTLLDLAPMRNRDATALAEQFVTLREDYRALCVQRSQGNPLYLTQLLSDPGNVVPDSLRHLIQARLDRLAPTHLRALSIAAVIGHRFDLGFLREVLQQPDYAPEQMGQQNLVRETQFGRYMFVHDLVMHCIYDAIPPAQRNAFHRDVAMVFQPRDASLYAQHLLRANDDGAFEALLAAAHERLLLSQYDGAFDLARQCDAFPHKAATSFDLAMVHGKAAAGSGNTTSARNHFMRAMMLAGDIASKIEVALGLAPVLNTLDSLEEERQLLEVTLPMAAQACNTLAQARLSYLRGNLSFPLGDYARCRADHEQALGLARTCGDAETEVGALSGIGDAYYAEGRMQAAHDVFDACVALCDRYGLAGAGASQRGARGSTAIYLGNPAEALRDSLDAATRAHAAGHRRAEIFARLTASWVLLATAQHAQAQEELHTALEHARLIGASRFEALLLEGLARAALQRNAQAEAESLILQAVVLVESKRLQRYIGPWINGTQALVTLDAEVRAHALHQGEAQLTQGCVAHNTLRFHVAAAELELLEGNATAARRRARKLADTSPDMACAWTSHHHQWIDAVSDWLESPQESTRDKLVKQYRSALELGYSHTMPRLMPRLDVTLRQP